MTSWRSAPVHTSGPVRVLTRKWPDSPHWEYDAVLLGADQWGTWVGVPQGTWLSKPDRGFDAWCDHVVLVPPSGWWLATMYGADADRPVDLYVDITTPAQWSADGRQVRAVDLDLDVIRDPDGTVRIDDEDEFAEHRIRLGYPTDHVAAANATCANIVTQIKTHQPPFNGEHLAWIKRLAHLGPNLPSTPRPTRFSSS